MLIIQTFVIPFFVTLVINNASLKAAMMATVVLNLSGLLNGLLHLFLRSNTAATCFGPKSSPGKPWNRQKHEIRIWGPNELAFNNYLADPVSGPRSPAELPGRSESRTYLVGPEKEDRPISLETLQSIPKARNPIPFNPLQSNAVSPTKPAPSMAEPKADQGSNSTSPKRSHARKQSYSLFPADAANADKSASGSSRQELTSVYDISDLQPPPPLFAGGSRGKGHKRDSSAASSATVQIGLRISHALPSSQATQSTVVADGVSLPSTTYNANPKRPTSPLRVDTKNISSFSKPPSLPLRSPRRPSPLVTSFSPTQPSLERGSVSNKTLPPTPKPAAHNPIIQRITEQAPTQLSPTVYSPQKKVTKSPDSPQSVMAPKQNPFEDFPQRSNSNREPVRRSKLDWI